VLIPAMTQITSEIIQSAPGLKLIQQFGVGLEGVDLEAAAARGIPVANVPGDQAPVHAECTAEGGPFGESCYLTQQPTTEITNAKLNLTSP
jgi:lactate dehydrogenase-like 2-hydroxyacid dehydrogenase